MKHSILTRSVSLLLALVMLLAYPASAAEVAALTDEETAATESSDPFDDSTIAEASEGGESASTDEAASEETDEVEEPVYLDSDGNYLAPEELVVYVTSYLTEGKNARTDTSYTGIVAFYDYNETDEEEMLDNPYFFYYEDGVLQDEEELYISSDRFLNLASAPTSAAAASVSDVDEDTAVYSAEEVYVDCRDEEATEHPDYLFAFNVDGQENGLYTGYSEVMAAAYEAGETVSVSGISLAQSSDGKSAILTWSAVSGAASYKVYRTTGSASASPLASGLTSTSYTDTKATTSGTTYSYYVTAVLSDGSETSASDTVTYTYYKTPGSVKAASAAGGVKVSWSSVSGATGYRVLRQVSGSSTWTTVGDVSGATSYVDTSASSNKTYSYVVRAYFGAKTSSREDYTVNVWSGVSASASVYYLAAPVISKTYSSSKGLVIGWSSVAGATSYRVYYRKVGASSWANSVTVTDTSFTYTAAESGSSYYFAVVADNSNNSTYSSYYNPVGDESQAITYHGVPNVTIKTVETGIQVTWTKDAAATGYRIFRRASDESSSTALTDITSGSTSTYIDTTVESGKTYYYSVRAYYGSSLSKDKNYSTNNWSSYKNSSTICFVETPQLVSPNSESNGMRVAWQEVSGASGYLVYRKSKTATSWTQIANISNGSTTSYLSTGVKHNDTYYYTVRAYIKDSSGNISYSYWQTPSTAYTYHGLATTTVKTEASGIRITWTLASKATGYRVYRKVNGKVVPIANISASSLASGATTASYLDSSANLTSGTTYQYTVRTYYGSESITSAKIDKLNNWSGYTYKSIVYLSTPTMSSTVQNNATDTNGIKVTWGKVTGAAGYYVYRRTSTSGKWSIIATINSGSTVVYLDTSVTSLSAGTTCYYTVVAFSSGKTGSSYYDTTGSLCIYLPMPEDLSVGAPSSSGTTITWSKVNGATSYIVYRRKNGSSSWTNLKTVTTNSYTDTTVTSKSTLYFYTIVAVATTTVNGKTVNFRSTYDKTGVSFGITWSGSERNTWVKKDGKQYYVESDGLLATGWQYKTRNGKTYKYYFDLETGELVTNLYAYFGKSYRDAKFRIVTCVCASSSTPSYTAIYLYNSDTDAYDTPAAAWRSIGSTELTYARSSSLYLAAGAGQRWLHGNFDGATYEQYAIYIHGTPSWFHSTLYGTESNRKLLAYTYNNLENNVNNSLACIRMQCIYAYLILDLAKNGYGKTHRTPVVLYKTSSVSAFGVPHLNKISTSKKYDPTDPDITGKFFYATSVLGISTTASSPTWVYY
ncbi:MAG: hypothetical protein LUG47_04385 [Clostridiales bacterium]|nr:hypothetical protein [Clostridiales bacterium]